MKARRNDGTMESLRILLTLNLWEKALDPALRGEGRQRNPGIQERWGERKEGLQTRDQVKTNILERWNFRFIQKTADSSWGCWNPPQPGPLAALPPRHSWHIWDPVNMQESESLRNSKSEYSFIFLLHQEEVKISWHHWRKMTPAAARSTHCSSPSRVNLLWVTNSSECVFCLFMEAILLLDSGVIACVLQGRPPVLNKPKTES